MLVGWGREEQAQRSGVEGGKIHVTREAGQVVRPGQADNLLFVHAHTQRPCSCFVFVSSIFLSSFLSHPFHTRPSSLTSSSSPLSRRPKLASLSIVHIPFHIHFQAFLFQNNPPSTFTLQPSMAFFNKIKNVVQTEGARGIRQVLQKEGTKRLAQDLSAHLDLESLFFCEVLHFVYYASIDTCLHSGLVEYLPNTTQCLIPSLATFNR